MKYLSIFLLLIINITVILSLPTEVKIKHSPDLKTSDPEPSCVPVYWGQCQTTSDCCPLEIPIPGWTTCCENVFMDYSICVAC